MAEPLYDVFISHAFEDKLAFADKLAAELQKAGLKVWYSGFELRLGDSIAGSVNKALKSAAFGIVIISPLYLQKQWAMNELNTFFAQETKQNRIIPILHNITVDEMRAHIPILADRYSIASSHGTETIAKKIVLAMASTGKHQIENGNSKNSNEIKSKPERLNADSMHEKSQPPYSISNTNNNSHTVTVRTASGWIAILLILAISAVGIYLFRNNSVTVTPAINHPKPVIPSLGNPAAVLPATDIPGTATDIMHEINNTDSVAAGIYNESPEYLVPSNSN
jgi:hypothetical protein